MRILTCDADHIAVDVERRTTGIALVHRGVDLYVVVVGPGANVAAARGNDTRGDCTAKTEWIPDRDHPITNPRRVLGKLDEREVVFAVDLDQSEISLRIGADHLGCVACAIVSRNLDRLA